VLAGFSLSIAILYKICYGGMANIRGFPLMQRLFFSLMATATMLMPHASLAQHRFGGGGYQQDVQQQQSRDYLELWFRDGRRVATYPLSNIDRHEDVAAQYGIRHCEQRWMQIAPPSGFGYAARITQGSCGNEQQLNHHNRHSNPGWNNNSGNWNHNQQWRQPSWNGGGCVYQNKHVRILCK
jgi:hypothetical protein